MTGNGYRVPLRPGDDRVFVEREQPDVTEPTRICEVDVGRDMARRIAAALNLVQPLRLEELESLAAGKQAPSQLVTLDALDDLQRLSFEAGWARAHEAGGCEGPVLPDEVMEREYADFRQAGA